MSGFKGDVKSLKIAVVLYLGVFLLKIAAYFVTGVMALFAEAFHTLSDMIISGFLLLAIIWSNKAADQGHLFGHGRAQNVAALVAATLFVSFTSFKLYEESIPKLFTSHSAEYQNLPVAIGVVLVSMVLAAIPFAMLARQKERGSAAKAQMRELINDELGLVAALLGIFFTMTGEPIGDPIAAIVVATLIAIGAVGLFRENMSLLIGASPGPDFIRKLEDAARSVEGVLGVHKIMAERIGPDLVQASLHVEVARTLTVEEADRISIQIHNHVRESTGCRYLTVHVDPLGAPRIP